MRMRRKKNRELRFENCIEYVAQTPEDNKGKWRTLFETGEKLHVEIGCGKGGFIATLAEQNPNICYIAMEKCIDALIMALEKSPASFTSRRALFSFSDVLLGFFL